MKLDENKIDWSQLTPEAAYKRITEFADKLSLSYPTPVFSTEGFYKFSWDKNSVYSYNGQGINKNHVFIRMHDKAIIIFSKYAFLPDDQPINKLI